jgi:hypothetical protein
MDLGLGITTKLSVLIETLKSNVPLLSFSFAIVHRDCTYWSVWFHNYIWFFPGECTSTMIW